MRMPHGSVTVLVIGIGAFVIYGLGRLDNAISSADNATTQDSKALLSTSRAYHQHVLALQNGIKVLQSEAKDLKKQGDSLEIALSWAIDSLQMAQSDSARQKWLETVRNTASSLDTARTKQCQKQELAVNACQVALTQANTRIFDLESQLGKQVKVGQCKILFINCPSRKVIAGGAFVLGVFTGLQIK